MLDVLGHLGTHWNYLGCITLMMIGLYIAISRGNLVKKIMGVNIFQASVILLYVSMGKITGGTAPILIEGRTDIIYSNPIPHVLMLTAIVVGVEEDEIVALDRAEDERALLTDAREDAIDGGVV
jgi:multisubunit Na+/H+ antiporter MnhC subunit